MSVKIFCIVSGGCCLKKTPPLPTLRKILSPFSATAGKSSSKYKCNSEDVFWQQCLMQCNTNKIPEVTLGSNYVLVPSLFLPTAQRFEEASIEQSI